MASVKDLSITNLHDLSRTSHTVKAVNKANKVLGLIKRTVGSAEKNIFFALSKSLVRQIIESSSLLLVKDIVHLEKSLEKDIAVGLRLAKGRNAL